MLFQRLKDDAGWKRHLRLVQTWNCSAELQADGGEYQAFDLKIQATTSKSGAQVRGATSKAAFNQLWSAANGPNETRAVLLLFVSERQFPTSFQMEKQIEKTILKLDHIKTKI
jgi:hypothetical protein